MKNEEIISNDAATTESVISSLQKVISLLDRIKNAIAESSSKIPKASVQLNTVTQATEHATVAILDVLDLMGTKIHTIENGISELEKSGLSDHQIFNLADIKKELVDLKESTNSITLALQVQDITAQKIGAANHLIETVRNELISELNYFENVKKQTEDAKKHAKEDNSTSKIYDMNASFMKTPEHQNKIDEAVNAWLYKNGK